MRACPLWHALSPRRAWLARRPLSTPFTPFRACRHSSYRPMDPKLGAAAAPVKLKATRVVRRGASVYNSGAVRPPRCRVPELRDVDTVVRDLVPCLGVSRI